MRRRTLLCEVTGAGVALLAGCTDGGGAPSARSPTTTPTAPDGEDGYRLVGRSFTVASATCDVAGAPIQATITTASSTPEATSYRLSVTGSINGNDTCTSARLGEVRRGQRGGELTVAVETYVPEDRETEACSQCLVTIEYEAVVTTAGGRPGAVVVLHDGDQVGRVDLPA